MSEAERTELAAIRPIWNRTRPCRDLLVAAVLAVTSELVVNRLNVQVSLLHIA